MNNRRIFFTSLTFLVAISACLLPGMQTVSAPTFAPTIDSAQLEQMVAATVSVAIAETQQSLPTPTLVPTASKPTQTATPEPIKSDSALTQKNGASIFSDERAGYQVTIPEGWLAVRVDAQEYYDAWTLAEAADPNIQETLLGVKSEDANKLRLLVIDTQDGHIQSDFVTEIRFVLDEAASFNSIEDLQAIADKIPSETSALRFEVTSVQTIIAPSGIQFGMIEANSSFTNASGDLVKVYQKRIYFKTKAGVQSVIFTTLESLKESTLTDFDAMIETIKLSPQ
jgi:hypothetical protein